MRVDLYMCMRIYTLMENIREIRKRLGLTQTEFAQALGLNQSTISRFERGELAVDKRTALAALALGQNVVSPTTYGEASA